jgi:glutamate N-acetyltransferase / amino-acid N-acetyltransferase
MTLATSGSATFERLEDASVTSARGFRAGAVAAGIKPSGKPDLGLLVSEAECVAVGTFTQNAFPAAPVVLSRQRLRAAPRAQAIVFNAGNANACTGERGQADVEEMVRAAGGVLGVSADLVLAASTGVIGQFLPMDRVRAGLREVRPRPDGGHEAARAIMTTDTRPKESAVALQDGVRIGAMTKGVGMIYPNMATMLAFIGTDARLEPDFAQACLKRVVERTFNMLTVDGDTSTNDSCFLLANGLSGITPDQAQFEAALLEVCTDLARMMARDGEGATKLIQVDVHGAASEADARAAARAVVSSSLLKAAVHGQDPNWGRVFAAVGYSGAQVDPLKAALWVGSVQVARDGMATDVPRADAQAQMRGEEVYFTVDLGLGSGQARAWGCDLTEGYVVENSAYTT